MAELVEQDNIIFRDKRRNRTKRGCVSAAETKRSLRAFPFSQRAFQAQVWRLRPADQPRGACADAEFVDGLGCRFAQSRIICKTEVIVRGEVQEPAACNFYLRVLRSPDFRKMSIERSRAERLQLLCEEVLHHKRLNCDANQLRIIK